MEQVQLAIVNVLSVKADVEGMLRDQVAEYEAECVAGGMTVQACQEAAANAAALADAAATDAAVAAGEAADAATFTEEAADAADQPVPRPTTTPY